MYRSVTKREKKNRICFNHLKLFGKTTISGVFHRQKKKKKDDI